MFNTVSARELQSSYTSVLNKAKITNKPQIVMRNNKPAGAIISMDLLNKLTTILVKSGDLELVDEETEARIGHAMEDLKEGRYTTVKTKAELDQYLKSL